MFKEILKASRNNQASIFAFTFKFKRDLIVFHKIVYGRLPISLPTYIRPFTEHERLRQLNLDSLSFVSHLTSNMSTSYIKSPFYKCFFYRILHTWNRFSFSVRNIPDEPNFKRKVTNYFWNELLSKI